jgi:hypothetical protein
VPFRPTLWACVIGALILLFGYHDVGGFWIGVGAAVVVLLLSLDDPEVPWGRQRRGPRWGRWG